MIPLLIASAVIVIYARSIRGEFLTDDQAIPDMEELRQFFSREWARPGLNFWQGPRALTHLGYIWTWRVWGLSPIGFHVGNIAIHLVNVFLVAEILERIGFPPERVLLAAAVFAVHPLQTHAVAWMSGRSGIQSAMFGYAGWVLLLTGFWPLAVVSQYLAGKSKEDGWLYVLAWPAAWLL